MKTLKQFIFEQLIYEYERPIGQTDDFDIEIGNHGDERKYRGMDSNFKINLEKITDTKIVSTIKKFNKVILDKISNNTLSTGNYTKSIQLIDYNITIVVSLKGISNDDKYILTIKSVWPTEDDKGTYQIKYDNNKKNKDNTKIFISDIKH